jgi:hypothetical protein
VDQPRSLVHHLGDLRTETREVGREDRGRHAAPARQLARHRGWSIDWPQWLQERMAVLDILTIVECSPQLGHTETSSKRRRQYTQR